MNCANCGHPVEHHTRRGCGAVEGQLECKCYRFRPPDNHTYREYE